MCGGGCFAWIQNLPDKNRYMKWPWRAPNQKKKKSGSRGRTVLIGFCVLIFLYMDYIWLFSIFFFCQKQNSENNGFWCIQFTKTTVLWSNNWNGHTWYCVIVPEPDYEQWEYSLVDCKLVVEFVPDIFVNVSCFAQETWLVHTTAGIFLLRSVQTSSLCMYWLTNIAYFIHNWT